MIWICRLLCPNGHVIAAGATDGADDESEPVLARSFLLHLKDACPELDCDAGCRYKVDLQTMTLELKVHVEATGCQTMGDAHAMLANEARQLRIKEFVHRSRN